MCPHLKEIIIPKLNEELVELIGVHLGDGTLTKNFIRIFGDLRYDSYYFNYLSRLIENLFGVRPSITTDKRKNCKKNTLILYLCSKKFCEFLHDKYKLPYGDKIRGKARIPSAILKNMSLTKACIRGLVDTDGSLSRRDNYLCLVFNSNNPILMNQIRSINKKLRIFSHEYKNEIGTNSRLKIINFFIEIGSSNLSRIIRFKEYYYNKKFLYKREVLDYLNLYKGVNLPFKLGP